MTPSLELCGSPRRAMHGRIPCVVRLCGTCRGRRPGRVHRVGGRRRGSAAASAHRWDIRTGGMFSSNGRSWVTSLRLPPVSDTTSGMPAPSSADDAWNPAGGGRPGFVRCWATVQPILARSPRWVASSRCGASVRRHPYDGAGNCGGAQLPAPRSGSHQRGSGRTSRVVDRTVGAPYVAGPQRRVAVECESDLKPTRA
jgi:hypothetical protein